MKKLLKSKLGISPILATLLLIVIAVAAIVVTYAWIMTFTSSTTSRSGAILSVENIRFYNETGTLKIDVTIRNSGTADTKVAEVYQGTSSSNLSPVSSSSLTYVPDPPVINVDSSLTITISPFSWSDGTRYYFRVVTEAGQTISFSEEA